MIQRWDLLKVLNINLKASLKIIDVNLRFLLNSIFYLLSLLFFSFFVFLTINILILSRAFYIITRWRLKIASKTRRNDCFLRREIYLSFQEMICLIRFKERFSSSLEIEWSFFESKSFWKLDKSWFNFFVSRETLV
jgi:hypothetical protein